MTSARIVLSAVTSDTTLRNPVSIWEVTLDRLELDVVRMEHHLALGRELRTDIWDVPRSLTPLPEELRERAADLHSRQQQCLEQLATSLGTALRQHAVAEAVARVAPSAHGLPRYVDIAV